MSKIALQPRTVEGVLKLERDIEITLSALSGGTYRSVGLQYSVSGSVVSSSIDRALSYLCSSDMRQELEAAFPRSQYPEAYYDFWRHRAPEGYSKHTFAISCISMKALQGRKDVLSKYLNQMLQSIKKERTKLEAIENNCVYLSDRGIPLLYVAEPRNVPVVTLENYTKWYNVFLVMPSGEVEVVKDVLGLVSKFDDAWWVDHLYHPRLLYRLAQVLNATVDERAIEVAAGRWMIERLEADNLKFDDPSFEEEN